MIRKSDRAEELRRDMLKSAYGWQASATRACALPALILSAAMLLSGCAIVLAGAGAAWAPTLLGLAALILVACGDSGGSNGGDDGGDSGGPDDATPNPPTLAFSVRDGGTIHSGFLAGTATAKEGSIHVVEVSIDGGDFEPTVGRENWTFQLPTGAQTWLDGEEHSISIRTHDDGSDSDVATLTVRKGANRDVNGDGYEDLAVGADNFNTNQGRVYVFLSQGAGGVADTDLSDTGMADTTLTGAAASNFFGRSAALGDVNGDGYADLAVGAISANAGAGGTYIFHSAGASGIPDTDLSGASADTTLIGAASGDRFGDSIALGDVNGDGYADIVVGARGFGADQGRAYIFHSAGDNGVADSDLSSDTADTTLTGTAANNFFGFAVALGDVTGDGFADVSVGAYGYSSFKGRVHIFHSAGASGVADSDLSTDTADTTLTGPSTIDYFGYSLALGDVNGDGFADIAVGEFDVVSAGKAYVFESAGIGGVADSDLSGIGTADTVLTGEAGITAFGAAVALGDVNGDGYDDIAVGAFAHSTNRGRVYVFKSAGSGGVANSDLSDGGTADTTLTGAAAGNTFGTTDLLGDLNGDGFADVAVSASSFNSSQGRVYVFESAGSGGVADSDLSGVGIADTTLTGGTGSTKFGISLPK